MQNKRPSKLLITIASLVTFIIGDFTWRCPPWLVYLRQRMTSCPSRVLWGIVSTVIILFLLGGYGYHWYSHLPRPLLVTAAIRTPQITPVEKVLVPDKLDINFGIENEGFIPKSVAPLKLIGKEVTQGVTINPMMPGTWNWKSDSRLLFTPTNDWPAGQTYTLKFAKNFFAPGVKMKSFTYSFSTQPFQVSIAEFKFYQDPINPALRQAVATIRFNYPVDTSTVENNITLSLQALKNEKVDLDSQRIKYTISYDENKRTAYLRSESLPLPEVERYLDLRIDNNIKSISGTSNIAEPIVQSVLIPDAGSYLKVSSAAASIVRNDKDRPEQVLTLETTVGVTDADLNKALHVYLLPQDYPATASEAAKEKYNWQNPGEVTPEILSLSTELKLKAIPADHDYATLHSYVFTAETPRFIYLKLDKGIHGFGDFVLANDYSAVIPVPAYPKEISFLHDGSLLALSGEKKLSVVVRGLPAVKFELARVLPDDVSQLVTQTQGDFNNPRFTNPRFNQENISEIFSDIQKFDTSDLAKAQYTALDIGKYLAAKTNVNGPQGLFLLRARGWDVENKLPLQVKNSRLILITDLGLLVKDNVDNTHDVFVQSITQGKPVDKVVVSVLGKNGLPIMTRTTGVDGRATFPTLVDFTEEHEPTVYLARSGNDVAFMPYDNADRQLNYSRFEVGGVYSNGQDLQNLTAYVFSDRGIYRPGDKVHVGMIVKKAYAGSQPAGLPLEATVVDPRGVTLKDQKITLDSSGYFTLDFDTNASSPTGQYTVNLYIVKDKHASNLLGSTTVRVAEFLPDRMRITTHLSEEQPKGWVSPVGLTATAGLWNLYGAPAADRKMGAKILLTPQVVQFSEYPNYIFMDPLLDPKKPPKTFTDTLSDMKTDSKGQAVFDLKLDRFEKATYHLTVFTEGFEAEGGRSVTAQVTQLVSPLSYFVGYKPNGDLNFIKQNGERSVHFIAINPQLKQQAVANLTMQLLALRPVTTLVKKPDGTYHYQSLIQTTVVKTNPFVISDKGDDYVLPTQQIGDYAIAILDQNNTELSRVKFSVVGASQLPLPKNAELSVKLNKSEYAANEDIEMEITAPYVGSGLITIERDKVYATQWFKTSTTSSVQKIHIPKEFEGNGYVNITFVRDWDSSEIFMSPLSYSVMPFSVNHASHAITIDLNTQPVARPGEPFRINYKSNKPGKIIVFAVDEGILQVADYHTPDPLEFFFQKQALEVRTQQIVDQILPKFTEDRELSAVGGDGGKAAILSTLNPFKRKTDLPVVYWSGVVDTDATMRQLVYQVPDYFNGKLRVMAVAVADNSVGSATKSSEIRGNFVINPNVPTFVAPGDEFEITASVANNIAGSGSDAPVAVKLEVSPELEVIGSTSETLKITENQEKTVHFKLRAKSELGSATVTLTASKDDKVSKMAATLSVRPANVYLTSITSGYADKAKSLKLDREMYPSLRVVEAEMSSNPLVLVAGLHQYLDKFPYGCTEQLVSKAWPLLAMANQSWFVKEPKMVTDKIEATIQMLGQRQMATGGFSYWPSMGANESNQFASVYAMHFLTEARAAGYTIPSDMLHTGIGYLRDFVTQDITNAEQARIQAYAIYVLTRNEIVTTNYLTHLQLYLDKDKTHAWRNDITGAYIAATYQLLKSYSEADKLIGYYDLSKDKANESSDFYNKNIADAQYLYLIARHFPERLPKLGNDLVMSLISAMNSDEINTLQSGYISLALSAYATAATLSSGAAFSISETLHNGKQKTIPALDNVYQKIDVENVAQKINFNNPDKQGYFYQLTQSGFDKVLPTKAISQGLEVVRQYRNADGTTVDTVNLGSEIEVHIQLRSLDDRYLSNIAIVDLLPGGFEVVRDSVTTTNMDYADVREDRVVFFGGANSDAKELVYRIKAVNSGKYTVPPIFAGSMYDPNVKAIGVAERITVVDAP